MQKDILLKQLQDSLGQLRTAIEIFQKEEEPHIELAQSLHSSLADSSKLASAFLVLKEQGLVIEAHSIHEKSKEINPNMLDVMIEPVFEIENNSEEELAVPITIVEF